MRNVFRSSAALAASLLVLLAAAPLPSLASSAEIRSAVPGVPLITEPAELDASSLSPDTVPAQCRARLSRVWGASPRDVFAVGEKGSILRYDGRAWTPMASGTTRDLHGIWGTGPSHVLAVGDGGTVLRYDGTAWTPLNSGTDRALAGIWGSADTAVWVAGRQIILRYDGREWRTWFGGFSAEIKPELPNRSIWGAPHGDVHIVGGSSKRLLFARDTLNHWDAAHEPAVHAVWGASHDSVYAVGDGGTVLRFDGGTWTRMAPTGTEAILGAVWGTSGRDVFAVGNDGVIIHYDGTAWTAMRSGTRLPLTGIWGAAPDDVFVVGIDGVLLHYDGTAWSPLPCRAADAPAPSARPASGAP